MGSWLVAKSRSCSKIARAVLDRVPGNHKLLGPNFREMRLPKTANFLWFPWVARPLVSLGGQACWFPQAAKPESGGFMKTTYPKVDEIPRNWHLVDARDQVLGRMAARVARVLMGKHRPIYTPHLDTGEFVVVVNAEKVKVTGRKKEDRMLRYHTGYIGGLREIPLGKMLEDKPAEAVRLAVRRMLPKTKLGRQMLTKLKIYAGENHPHEAQNPQPLDWRTV